MNILFTHSYFYRFDAKQWKAATPYPPLATIMAAALLRQQGHDVRLFDAALAYGPQNIKPHLAQKPDVLVIYDDGFNYLTKMCLTRMRQAAFDMAEMAQQQHIPVVVCSSDATDRYEKYLNHGCNFVIAHEGELTLAELIAAMQSNQLPDRLPAIQGLIYKEAGHIQKTPPRPVMQELDSLPLPAWDLINMEAYRNVWLKHHGYFSLNIATTRGCPYKCNWCAKPIYGNRYHARSVARVVDEIALLTETYNAQHFWFCDDIFGLKPNWVQQFTAEIQKRKLHIKYKIQSRVDLLLKDNMVEALAASGADEVWVGAESGSQKILDAMDKGTQVEQINLATQKLKAHGIHIGYFLQFGYPGENKADIKKTLHMLLHNMPHDMGVSISYPLPGTVFYEKVKQGMQAKQNWTDSNDLYLMYSGTYSPKFYKILHSYVHKRFRLKGIYTQWLNKTPEETSNRHLKTICNTIKQGAKACYYLVFSMWAALLLKIHSLKPRPVAYSSQQFKPATEAFSRQAKSFENTYKQNPIIQKMRYDVHRMMDPYLKKDIRILELNAGTGVDATYFTQKGCYVKATDNAEGMLEELHKKAADNNHISVQKADFKNLDTIEGQYDIIFSNFAGLNCNPNPDEVFQHFSRLLKPQGKVCLVMLGKFCLWEFLMALKGNFKVAFRRFGKKAPATIEGIAFETYYFSPAAIQRAMGRNFYKKHLHGIGVFMPPPYLERHFFKRPRQLNLLYGMDVKLAQFWPFNVMGDLFLATYEYRPV